MPAVSKQRSDLPGLERLAIQISAPQREFLNDQALALGINVPELLRRLVDAWRFEQPAPPLLAPRTAAPKRPSRAARKAPQSQPQAA
jgi:hypothetical protein